MKKIIFIASLLMLIGCMEVFNSRIKLVGECNKDKLCRVVLINGDEALCDFPKVGDIVRCNRERKDQLAFCDVVFMPWEKIDD